MLFNPIKPWYLYQPTQLWSSLADRFGVADATFVTRRLAWGVSIRVQRHRVIGTGIIRNGVFDLAVSEALYRLADAGEQALDVGANIGYMSSILGTRLGGTGRLWCFEPHPDLHAQLQRNVELFRSSDGFAPTELRHAALSDRDGAADLACPSEFERNEGVATLEPVASVAATHTVSTWRADSLFPGERFGVVKLDVEGHELKVLQGASSLLQQGRIRDLVFEDHHGPASEVCRLLTACGYRIFQLGWSLRGPVTAPAGAASVHSRFDAPSYLATLDPPRAASRLSPAGWKILSKRGSALRTAA